MLEIFFVFVNMGPMGAKTFKAFLILLQIAPDGFKISLNFPLNGPHKNTLEIIEILSFRFLPIFFFRRKNVSYGKKTNKKTQLSGKQAFVEGNGMKFGTRGYQQYIWRTFGLVTLKVILGHLSVLRVRIKIFYIMSLRIWRLICCKGAEIGHRCMLLLNINRKSYMGRPTAPSDLALSDIQRLKSRSLRL